MSPIFTRASLGITLAVSVAVSGYSLWSAAHGETAAWATLAAALAVIASVVSAWGAQRVVELEEDKLRPYPFPYFDATSRYGLMLFRLSNTGGSSAYNVRLAWDDELKDHKGNRVTFAEESLTGAISVLRPEQSLTKIVDGHVQFFQIKRNHVYRGTVHFEDSHGVKRNHRFIIDAEVYKGTPLYEDESLETHRKLQEIPKHLQEVKRELELIRRKLRDDDQT